MHQVVVQLALHICLSRLFFFVSRVGKGACLLGSLILDILLNHLNVSLLGLDRADTFYL